MKKIVHIITKSDPIGGAQVVLFNLVANMADGYEVMVIVGESGMLTKMLGEIGIKTKILNNIQREINLFRDIKALQDLKRELKRIDPDLVILHSSKVGLLGRVVCKQLNISNIFTVHGWSFSEGVPPLKKTVYKLIEQIFSIFTNKIITVSKYDKQLGIKHKVSRMDNTKVILNGTKDMLDEKIKKDTTCFRGIMVARFDYPKDHKTLFQALLLIKKEIKLKIDLVGTGTLLDESKKLAYNMGIAHMLNFHGQVSTIGQILNKCHFYILSSNHEGLPLSIIEAMSCKIPIIATNVGGIGELVEQGYNGYLFERQDYITLAGHIKKLFEKEKLYTLFSKNSRKRYLSHFTVKKMVDESKLYYNKVINER